MASQNLSRRTFLKGAAATGLIALLHPSIAFAENIPADDFTLVEKSLPKDLIALKRFLTPPNTLPPSNELLINVGRLPELVYNITVQKQESKVVVIIPESLGSAFILNKEGFFLSAYHVFADQVEKQEKEDLSSTALMYESNTGKVASARTLMYSKQHDIFLGRVKFPESSHIEEMHLSPYNCNSPDLVWTVSYGKDTPILNSLLKEILESGKFIYPEEVYPKKEASAASFQQVHPVKKESSFFQPLISIGHVVDVLTTEGKPVYAKEEYAFLHKAKYGDSGSPVFDVRERVQGIMTHMQNLSDENGEKQGVGIFVGQAPIRAMIEKYIVS